MFEDQKVELLPERTTMQSATLSFNSSSATAANVANMVAGRGARQANVASALSLAGVSIKLH